MAIEAPISKYKKNSLIIAMVVLIGFGIYCIRDGYYNEKFMEKHKDADGNPDSTLIFNQKSPPFLIGAGVLSGVYLLAIRKKKIIADESELTIDDKQKIPYDSMQKIDKTHFKSKGFFIITYKNNNGREVNRKLSDRRYDNLEAILDHLVAQIS